MPLIELSDAVNVVDGYKRRNPDSWSLCNSIRCDIEELSTLSPDDVRGVGRWVRISGFHLDHEYHPARYQCDQCKHFVDSGDDRNYCPNCGAKMKGAEENHTMDEFMYGQEMGSHSDGSL